jgi:hypothetical protein
MKNTFLILAFNFLGLTVFGQQWTTGTNNLLYTTTGNVSVGSSTIQGGYSSSDRVIEVVSPSTPAGTGSYLSLKNGTDAMFLSLNSLYPSGFYWPGTKTFGFFVNSTSIPSLLLQKNGAVSIGTTLNPVGYKLAVNGKIIAEELRVQLPTAWPDYVFGRDYKLPTLQEVEKQILDKGHLVNIPSADEVKANGIAVGEMNKLLLEKVEELTLYAIEQNKISEKQSKEIEELKAMVKALAEKK